MLRTESNLNFIGYRLFAGLGITVVAVPAKEEKWQKTQSSFIEYKSVSHILPEKNNQLLHLKEVWWLILIWKKIILNKFSMY